MNRANIVGFMKALGAKGIAPGDKWVRSQCPLAPWTHDSGHDKHPSFAIKVNINGESIYNCFACQNGDLMGLILTLKSFGAGLPRYDLKTAMTYVLAEEEQDVVFDVKDPFEPPPIEDKIYFTEQWLSTFPLAWNVPMAQDYLESRQVSQEIATWYDLRWDVLRKAVCFPIRNFSGQLSQFRGRYISPGEGPSYHVYKNSEGEMDSTVWLGEDRVSFDSPVLMVESVFDATSARRVYANIVAPMTVGMSKEKILRMGFATEIVTLFDNGKGGDKARNLISRHFKSALVTHVTPFEHRKDAGECTEPELRNLLAEHLTLL